jgi:hypothetical protein
MSFVDTGKDLFLEVVSEKKINGPFRPGKKYYRVDKLNKRIEDSDGLY